MEGLVGLIMQISEFMGVFSVYVNRTIEYVMRLIMELLHAFYTKITSYKEKIIAHGFNGPFNSIIEGKEDKYVF